MTTMTPTPVRFETPTGYKDEIAARSDAVRWLRIPARRYLVSDGTEAPGTPEFKDAIGRLIADRAGTSLCLMCAEKEPLDCHRTVLVSRRLADRDVPIEHLLADGTVRPHRDIEEALLKKAGGGADLFEDRQARLDRAYQARERTMKGKSA